MNKLIFVLFAAVLAVAVSPAQAARSDELRYENVQQQVERLIELHTRLTGCDKFAPGIRRNECLMATSGHPTPTFAGMGATFVYSLSSEGDISGRYAREIVGFIVHNSQAGADVAFIRETMARRGRGGNRMEPPVLRVFVGPLNQPLGEFNGEEVTHPAARAWLGVDGRGTSRFPAYLMSEVSSSVNLLGFLEDKMKQEYKWYHR